MSVSEAKTNGKEALKRMTIQEQAFRAYYASMTDAGLLRIAVNRSSFVDIAQKVLADELNKTQFDRAPGRVVFGNHVADVDPSRVGPAHVGLDQVGPAEIANEAGLAKVGPN